MFSRTITARRVRVARVAPARTTRRRHQLALSLLHLRVDACLCAASSDNLDMCPVMPWLRSRADRAEPDETPRNRRQEETFRKVLTAGVEMLRESSYADLTVRAVAARAKVAPATAYTYFSSKNHLIAEVYLDLMQPGAVLHRRQRADADPRREGAARLALVVADEPEVAAACTTALLTGSDPTRAPGPRPHRRRDPPSHPVGGRPRRRPARRVGPGDDVLRRAGQRRQRRIHLPPDRRPAQLRRRPHPWENDTMTVNRAATCCSTRTTTTSTRTRTRTTSGCATRRRCTATTSSKFWALSRHADVVQGFRNSTTLSNKHGVSLDPDLAQRRTRTETMSFLALDDPGHLRLRTLVSKGFTPQTHSRAGGRGSPRSPCSTSTRCCELQSGDTVRLRRRLRRQAADGRHLRTDGRARRGPRSASARWPTA